MDSNAVHSKVCTFNRPSVPLFAAHKSVLFLCFSRTMQLYVELACVVTTKPEGGGLRGIDTGEARQVLLTAVFPVMSVTDQVRERKRCWCK